MKKERERETEGVGEEEGEKQFEAVGEESEERKSALGKWWKEGRERGRVL